MWTKVYPKDSFNGHLKVSDNTIRAYETIKQQAFSITTKDRIRDLRYDE